ncbi:MAG: D-glycero-beta-D-manno-heptose 1,7-bisphosphate 7-phosphatase [Nevskiales bacterium]
MKLVILDRDGVINQDSPDYIKSPAEWLPIPGSLEAIARLNHAGWRVLVASNQSGMARGLFTLDTLFAIHDKMQRLCAELGGRIDGVFYCPHGPDENCDCRKPAPGLYKDIARRLQLDLKNVPVVGDSLRDLEAAQAAGAQPVLVQTGNGAETARKLPAKFKRVPIYADLAGFAAAVIGGAAR